MPNSRGTALTTEGKTCSSCVRRLVLALRVDRATGIEVSLGAGAIFVEHHPACAATTPLQGVLVDAEYGSRVEEA